MQSIFLVGGFAESTWLFLKVRERIELFGVTLSRPANSPLWVPLVFLSYRCYRLWCWYSRSYRNKAVADGAISFYIHNIVSARVAKYTYGLKIHTIFNPLNPEHARRKLHVFTRPDGEKALGGQYAIILPKVCIFLSWNMVLTPQCFNNLKDVRVSKTQEFRESFSRRYRNLSDLNSVRSDILCYHGHKSDPRWINTEPGDTAPSKFM